MDTCVTQVYCTSLLPKMLVRYFKLYETKKQNNNSSSHSLIQMINLERMINVILNDAYREIKQRLEQIIL